MAPMNMLIVKHLKHENNRSVIEIVIDREMTNLHGVLPETMEKLFLVAQGHKNTYRYETSPGDLVILDILKVLRKAHWALMTSHSFVHLSIEKTVESHFYFEKPSPKELEIMQQQQYLQMQMQNKFSNHANPNLNFHPLGHEFKSDEVIESLRSDSGDGTKNKMSAEVTSLLYDKSAQGNSGPYGFAKRQSYLTVQNPKIRKDLSISVDSTNGGELYLQEDNHNIPRSHSLDFDGSNKYAHYEQTPAVVKNEINPLRKELSPIRETRDINPLENKPIEIKSIENKPIEQTKNSHNSRSTTPTGTNKLLQKYSKKPFTSPTESKLEPPVTQNHVESIKQLDQKSISDSIKPFEHKLVSATKPSEKPLEKPLEINHSVDIKHSITKPQEVKPEQSKPFEKKPILEPKPVEVQPEKPKEEDQNKKLLKSSLSFLRTPRIDDEKEKEKVKPDDSNDFGSFLKTLRHVESPKSEKKKVADLLIEPEEENIPKTTVKDEQYSETKSEVKPSEPAANKLFENIDQKVDTTPQKGNKSVENAHQITPKSVATPLQTNFQSPTSSSITPSNIATTPSTDANDPSTRRSSVSSSSKLLSKYQPKRRSSVNSSSSSNLKSPSLTDEPSESHNTEEKKEIPSYKSPYLFPDHTEPIKFSESLNNTISAPEDPVILPANVLEDTKPYHETEIPFKNTNINETKSIQPHVETPAKVSEASKVETFKVAEPIKVEPPSPKPIITPSVNTSMLPKPVENKETLPLALAPPTLAPPIINPNRSLDEALEGLVDQNVEDVDLDYTDSNDYFSMSSNAFKRDDDSKFSSEHENSKTNHYSKLGSAFVSGNALNRGRGGGRGRGRGLM